MCRHVTTELYIDFFCFVSTFPGMAYQSLSSMTMSAAFVADNNVVVGRVRILLLLLLPLFSFMHRYIILSSSHTRRYLKKKNTPPINIRFQHISQPLQ